jgi:aerobic carbon-monoxide dehydrogenase small subunit
MTATAITLNGRLIEADAAPRTHLADFIREHAGLTGTHLGCEHGVCGACTVEIDGEIARSCIAFAVACDGASVRTIEGFDDDPLMARLRKAFTEEHALQCGYCTPGMLITARDLIERGAARTGHEIRIAMSGNLCRCTGYAGIVAAIKRVVDEDFAAAAQKDYARKQAFGLGPAGSHTSSTASAMADVPAAVPKDIGVPPVTLANSGREPVRVTTSAPQERGGLTTLTQSFVLTHPRDAVWAYMRDLERLIKCLPGAALENAPGAGGTFSGVMTVVFGPISPRFRGSGTFTVSNEDYSGHILGAGQDGRAGAKASGEMRFRLTARDSASTFVEAVISYKLTGALAQFGRPTVIRGIVTEIGSAFATNLDSALAGEEAAVTPGARKLGGGSILGAIVKAWISALRGWLRV